MAFKDNNQAKTFDIDAASIRELAELMEETGLTEIEVSEGERRIRVARGHAMQTAVHHVSAPQIAESAAAAPTASAAPAAGCGDLADGRHSLPASGAHGAALREGGRHDRRRRHAVDH